MDRSGPVLQWVLGGVAYSWISSTNELLINKSIAFRKTRMNFKNNRLFIIKLFESDTLEDVGQYSD